MEQFPIPFRAAAHHLEHIQVPAQNLYSLSGLIFIQQYRSGHFKSHEYGVVTVVKGQKGNRSVENKNVLFYWDDAFAGRLLIQNNHNRS